MKTRVVFLDRSEEPDAFFSGCLRAAAALRALGVGEGDVVALMMRNGPAALEAMLAVRWLGAQYFDTANQLRQGVYALIDTSLGWRPRRDLDGGVGSGVLARLPTKALGLGARHRSCVQRRARHAGRDDAGEVIGPE